MEAEPRPHGQRKCVIYRCASEAATNGCLTVACTTINDQFPLTTGAQLRLHATGAASCHLWAGVSKPGPAKSDSLSSRLSA